MPQLVFADANVLFSRTLRDWLFLLKIESHGDLFAVVTSEDVIAETLYRLRRRFALAPGELVTAVHNRIAENIDDRVATFARPGSRSLVEQLQRVGCHNFAAVLTAPSLESQA
jgi:hypothetical protein